MKTKKIAAGAVTGEKLAANAVTSNKIADGTITGADVGSSQLVKSVVFREFVAPNQAVNTSTEQTIQCAAGEQAIGGGGDGTIVGTRNFPNLDVDTQILASGPVDANEQAVSNAQTATGWHISVKVLAGPRDVHLYAACAQR